MLKKNKISVRLGIGKGEFQMKNMQETKERICAFYASDYHFEMMSLPYINKKIENKEEIIILTENNLEKTIQTFLSKTNLNEEKKKEILKLNWNNNNEEKIKTIKQKIDKEMTIFIKGQENYIQKMNKKIEQLKLEKNQIKIIDCYAMDEIGESMDEVMDQYNKVLRTTGEKER